MCVGASGAVQIEWISSRGVDVAAVIKELALPGKVFGLEEVTEVSSSRSRL